MKSRTLWVFGFSACTMTWDSAMPTASGMKSPMSPGLKPGTWVSSSFGFMMRSRNCSWNMKYSSSESTTKPTDSRGQIQRRGDVSPRRWSFNFVTKCVANAVKATKRSCMLENHAIGVRSASNMRTMRRQLSPST